MAPHSYVAPGNPLPGMYTGGAQPGFLALMADDVGIAEAYKIIPGTRGDLTKGSRFQTGL